MGHSVLHDLFVPTTPEGEPSRHAALKQLFSAPTIDERLQSYQTNPLVYAAVNSFVTEILRGICVARVDDGPLAREAYRATCSWLHAFGVRHELPAIARTCVVVGQVLVWVETKTRKCGHLVPGNGLAETLPVTIGPEDGVLFHEVKGSFDSQDMRQRLVDLVDAMLRDALVALALEQHRPHVTFVVPETATKTVRASRTVHQECWWISYS